jgi:hypothetical protein
MKANANRWRPDFSEEWTALGHGLGGGGRRMGSDDLRRVGDWTSVDLQSVPRDGGDLCVAYGRGQRVLESGLGRLAVRSRREDAAAERKRSEGSGIIFLRMSGIIAGYPGRASRAGPETRVVLARHATK